MTGTDTGSSGSHEARRVRIADRTALGGVLLGLLAAGAVGLLGASGRAGLAVVFAVSAAGCVLGALVTVALAVVDEYRWTPASRRRMLRALGYFLAGGLLLVLSAATVASA